MKPTPWTMRQPRILLFLLGLLTLGACEGQGAEGTIQFEGSIEAPDVLDVRTTAGFIHLVAKEGITTVEGQVTVRAEALGSPERARALRDEIRVAETQDGNVTRIEVIFPEASPGESWGADVYLEVPQGAAVQATSEDGTITVEGLEVLSLRSSNGDLTLSGTAGDAQLTTSNGKLVLTDHVGNLTAETTNGNIVIRGHTGNVDGRTTNAPISFTSPAGTCDEIALQTSSADINLTMPSTFAGKILAEAREGTIIADGLSLTRTVDDRDRLEARTNPGGAGQIELYTSLGEITLR